MKIAVSKSESVSQKYGSADPDLLKMSGIRNAGYNARPDLAIADPLAPGTVTPTSWPATRSRCFPGDMSFSGPLY